MSVPFPPDILRYIFGFLDAIDILHLGMTCHIFEQMILLDTKIWKYYVAAHSPVSLTYIWDSDDVDWKELAFIPQQLTIRIQHAVLSNRLTTTPKDKDFLSFYLRIRTTARVIPGVRESSFELPTQILTLSGTIQLGNKNVEKATQLSHALEWLADEPIVNTHFPYNICWFVFKTKTNTSVLFWEGESNIYSEYDVYAVDRLRGGQPIPLPIVKYIPQQTLLSKSQYEEIGQIAHHDKSFYTDTTTSSSSYNLSTAHGIFRNGTSDRYRFGSNSKTTAFDRPHVEVECWASITCVTRLSSLWPICGPK